MSWVVIREHKHESFHEDPRDNFYLMRYILEKVNKIPGKSGALIHLD